MDALRSMLFPSWDGSNEDLKALKESVGKIENSLTKGDPDFIHISTYVHNLVEQITSNKEKLDQTESKDIHHEKDYKLLTELDDRLKKIDTIVRGSGNQALGA